VDSRPYARGRPAGTLVPMQQTLPSNNRIGERAIARAREARRTIVRERHYHCSDCGFERRSWIDLRACPSCGSELARSARNEAALA
jgi:predicted RNA-binding Zn-ribbon protein involved in translation (DUF1610 family)